jgi:hypothetical protein
MASPEYHHKQAELLAGLALTSPDPVKAEQLSFLALEHHALAGKRKPGQLPSSPPSSADHNHDHA